MQLLYTGAIKQFETQLEPIFSLGGLLSSTPVANDFFGNMFGEITLNTLKNNIQDHICLGLISDQAIEGITLTVKTTKHNQGRFRIGAVKLTKDDCDKFSIPKIQNQFSKPVNVKFHNCTSFYGENLLEFSIQPNKGESFEVYSSSNLIGEFIYSDLMDDYFIYPDYLEDFEFEARWNVVENKTQLFLIQKNLGIFDPAIEIIRVLDQSSVEDITNQLPSVNLVDLGSIEPNEMLALYFERSLSKETLQQNRKLNCEKIFQEYKSGFQIDKVEKMELEIDYELTAVQN